MKRIDAIIALLAVSLIVVMPSLAADLDKPASAKQEGTQKGASTSDVMFITTKVPLGSPLFAGYPVALVNDDTITTDDLIAMLASSHKGRMEGHGDAKSKLDFDGILDRLIRLRLIVQEAKATGLDELPGVREEIESFKETTLIQLLLQDLTARVAIDEKETESLYRDMVREWKIKSILFRDERAAKKAAEALKQGGSFDDIVSKALQDGTAEGSEEGQYVRESDLAPAVASQVSKMKAGSISPVISVGSGKNAGFTLVRLEGVRYPEDAGAREEARQTVLARKRGELIKKEEQALYRKYVKVDKKLLNSINYDSPKPGMARLVEDKRVLVRITGEEPVTVKELSLLIRSKFFHGVEKAMKEKRVESLKEQALDSIVTKRVFRKEALLRGLDKTPQYQRNIREREDSILFGMFVKKVIAPKVKLGDEDIRAYYNDHLAEYQYPAMVKMTGLAFDKLPDAESALEKLKKGADYIWIKENATGQTDPDADNLLNFDGVLIITKLSQDVQKALDGAKAGDHRLAAGTDGRYYVLSIQEMIPGRTQTVEEATSTIAQKVYNVKLDEALKEWSEKLKQASDIEIYLQ